MKSLAIILSCGLLVSTAAFAAKVDKIKVPVINKTSGGQEFRVYAVRCTDMRTEYITAWNNRKEWCAGDTRHENCGHSKQQAAADVCGVNRPLFNVASNFITRS